MATDPYTIRVRGDVQRQRVKQLADRVPEDWTVTFAEPRRTDEQSRRMFAMIGDLVKQKPAGREHTKDQWKAIMMDACDHKPVFVPNLEGTGFLCLGYKSSRLTKAQMSDVIECIAEFGARHDVRWSEPHPDHRQETAA